MASKKFNSKLVVEVCIKKCLVKVNFKHLFEILTQLV